MQVLKMNSFTRIFQGFHESLSNLAMTWEDCFYKPKLFLDAIRLLSLNRSINI